MSADRDDARADVEAERVSAELHEQRSEAGRALLAGLASRRRGLVTTLIDRATDDKHDEER